MLYRQNDWSYSWWSWDVKLWVSPTVSVVCAVTKQQETDSLYRLAGSTLAAILREKTLRKETFWPLTSLRVRDTYVMMLYWKSTLGVRGLPDYSIIEICVTVRICWRCPVTVVSLFRLAQLPHSWTVLAQDGRSNTQQIVPAHSPPPSQIQTTNMQHDSYLFIYLYETCSFRCTCLERKTGCCLILL